MAKKKKTPRPAVVSRRIPSPAERTRAGERAGEDQVASPDGRTRQLIAQGVAQVLRQEYERTSNPLYAWRAYLECRAGNVPIPDWVLPYFDRVAARFRDLTSPGRTPSRGPAAVVAKALEMSKMGAGTVFSTYDRRRDAMLADQAAQELERCERGNWNIEVAFKRVAKAHNVSPDTVKRAYKMFKD